jgi:prephenate dehydratase
VAEIEERSSGGPPGIRVAFQGDPGAYSELAARKRFGPGVITVPRPSFAEVFRGVEEGECDEGILPIENSTAGSITETYDLLLDSSLWVRGESYLRVEHCLLVRPGVDLDRVRRVHSHPQALAQCAALLARRGLESHPSADTAGAARWLARSGTDEDAVLASDLAAELYGLEVAVRGAQNELANTTRFILVGQKPPPRVEGPSKTSLVLELGHAPGSLFGILEIFARSALNLTKIESRPLPRRNWEYRFYLDFEGSRVEARVDSALDEVRARTAFLRVLGSYPAAARD